MDNDKLLAEMKDRFKVAMDADYDERTKAIEDLEFIQGGDFQWDSDAIAARKNRPRLTVNKLPKFVRQVTGDQRQNRPSVKVRPVDSVADPMLAEVFEGHIRNIEYNSDASIAYDNAFKQACSGGYPGFWRIDTEYTDDDSFEQDIVINPIWNNFTVYPDPVSIKDVYKGGLDWCFVTETIPEDEFKRRYPKEVSGDWEQGEGEQWEGWFLENEVRIAEYWYREPYERTLYLLETGETVAHEQVKDALQVAGSEKMVMTMGGMVSVIRERKAKSHKVKWCMVSGNRILEGPKDVAGKYIRIVPVFGDTWNIQGKTYYKSLIRDAKDPQKMYNYMVSQNVEMTALAPKVPYLVTPQQIEGHETIWKTANTVPHPYLPYNPDPRAAALPQRSDPVVQNTGYVQLAMQATEDLQETTGIFKAALGQSSNERTGRAIRERKQESDVGMFEFLDNLTRAITFTGKILVDLIPRIYDTERTLRLLNFDGKSDMVEINKQISNPDGSMTVINDITVGKYDVYVTVGPSYTTQRMEAADSMMQIIQAVPDIMAMAGDIIMENLDWPGAADIAKRLAERLQAQQMPMPGAGMAPPQGQV